MSKAQDFLLSYTPHSNNKKVYYSYTHNTAFEPLVGVCLVSELVDVCAGCSLLGPFYYTQ